MAGGVENAVASPRARVRTLSIRVATSVNSLRASVRSLRSFTRR